VGVARDLLQQAEHLATYEGVNPNHANLRRAVSTAYYALFHLLVEEAGARWQGSPEAPTGLERSFNHGAMKTASIQFRQPTWRDWHDKPRPVPAALQKVAGAFVDLQQERHIADYDNHQEWSTNEVEALLDSTRSAFRDWESIRTDPMAGNYLLMMLLPKQRA
jgi:uncharacterized protein (UPF0332 family)